MAWGSHTSAPGLLAAGGALNTSTLLRAYAGGIFPWFSHGQPILWWCPEPRMVLECKNFRLHRSLQKTLVRFSNDPSCELRIDSQFDQVIAHCANRPRKGQSGTWIVDDMVSAYRVLHAQGHAHSVETWANGQLVGGLYCINIGGMVFGESMFALSTDASKIALAALVAFCKTNRVAMIDCQQNTAHLASLGAAEISRTDFETHLQQAVRLPSPTWTFSNELWQAVLPLVHR